MPHRMFVTVQYDGDGSDQPDHKSATKAIELLQKHKEERFFLAVGFVRPHYPMVAPRQYFEKYDWKTIKMPEVIENDIDDIPKLGRVKTMNSNNPIGKYPDNQKRMWEGYYASTTFMDEQVGRVIDELDRLGLRDSTAIVFTSDHGYHLGEHTFWQKSTLHEEVSRVPLIISAPGQQPGRSDAFAELMDIYPTVMDLTGLKIPDSVQGKSLVPVLKDPGAKVRDAALTLDSGYGLRGDKWAYFSYHDGTEELYDMKGDAQQFHNRAGNPEFANALKERRAALAQRLEQAKLKAQKKRRKQE
jgi:iduronate 2-sulfatase